MAAHIYAEYEGLNATQLESQLENVCNIVPMSYQQQCKVMVSAFGLTECECITTPTAQFNATSCCADVALCSSLDVVAKLAAKPDECQVCESAVTTANVVSQYLGWNSTVCAAKIGAVCQFVPMQYQMECQTLITTFGKVECQCITDPKFDAQLCCSDLGVCPMPPLPAPVLKNDESTPTIKGAKADYCSSCKVIATAIHYLAEVAGLNGKQLDADVQVVCHYVPVEYQAECQDVISIGGAEVADCVTNSTSFDAQTCCNEAGLCATPSRIALLKLKL